MVLYIVLFTPQRLSHLIVAPSHFVPLKSTITEIFFPPKYNVKAHYTEVAENFFGNILLFMPFGFLMNCFFAARKKMIILTACLFSGCIEALQLIFHLGVCDVDDVLLNVLGTWLGILLSNFYLKKKKI